MKALLVFWLNLQTAVPPLFKIADLTQIEEKQALLWSCQQLDTSLRIIADFIITQLLGVEGLHLFQEEARLKSLIRNSSLIMLLMDLSFTA